MPYANSGSGGRGKAYWSQREEAILKILKEKHDLELTCSISELEENLWHERDWIVDFSDFSVEEAAAKIKEYHEEYIMSMSREEIEDIIQQFVDMGALVRKN